MPSQAFPRPVPDRNDSPVRACRARHGLIGMMLVAVMPGYAHAQSIGDWEGTYHAPPTPKPHTPKPSPTLKSSPPTIAASPVIVATATARPPRKAQVHRHARTPAATPQQAIQTPPTAVPGPTGPVPASMPTATIRMPKPRPTPHPAPQSAPDLPQWPLGLAALLGGAAGWALWRRKSPATPNQHEPEPVIAAPPPPPIPSDPPAAATPHIEPQFIPTPVTARASGDLALDFVPTRLTTTLTEAILRYSLTVTNLGHAPLGPLVIVGAMEAAGQNEPPAPDHPPSPPPAFRPAPGFSPHPQFTPMIVPSIPKPPPPEPVPGPAAMAECHRLAALASGESAELRGQLRLPLSDIAPMRVGAASLFIPLVRLNVEAARIDHDGAIPLPLTAQLCMMVGETAQEAADQNDVRPPPLGPFRLDAGPATARHLSARPVPIPDDPVHAAL